MTWPDSQTSVLGKVLEQVILNAVTRHMQIKQVIRPSKHRFVKGRSCLCSLISSYGKMTLLVDEGKLVNLLYLAFSKVFDTVSTAFFWRN